MKTIYFKYFILIFTMGILNSCNDYLSEDNPNAIAKDSYWRDLSETEKGVNAIYQTLNNPLLVNIIEEAQRSDMGWPGYGRPAPQRISEFYNQSFTNSTNALSDKWQANYVGVFRANQVIEALERLEGTVDQEEWTSQMAQAKFFRGLFHFYLYTTFNNGSIIIRDVVPVSNEDFNKALSPAEDVIKFIREDLEYAYANLYAKGEYPGTHDVGRATSGAAATILGTSYLYEKDYPKAMLYFDDIIKNHDYELVYDMDKLFTTAGENNEESILEISCNYDLNPEANLWNGETVTNRLNQRTNGNEGAVGPTWLAYKYKTEPMDPLDERNYYEDPEDGKTQRNVPLRASAMMAIVEDAQTPYYIDASTTENMKVGWNGWGFAWHKKFTNHDIVTTENDLPYGTLQSGKNITLNRLAEVLLMQAECLIQTGDLDGAIELMNRIRKRWGLVLLGESNGSTSYTYDEEIYTAESLMEHLMYVEKPLEISLEGHAIRFLDLKRWGVIEENFKKLSEETYYLLHYNYKNAAGKNAWRWFGSIVKDPGSQTYPPKVVDYEYDIPYSNYNAELHSTYPIPLTEINANTNIN